MIIFNKGMRGQVAADTCPASRGGAAQVEAEWERQAYKLYMSGDTYGALSLAQSVARSAAGRRGAFASCHVAELMGRMGGGMVTQAWREWERGRQAAASPSDDAMVLAVAVGLCRVDRDVIQTRGWVDRLHQHLRKHRGHPLVERWWPRVRTGLAELAVACGDTRRAIEHLGLALAELPAMEPNPAVCRDMQSVIHVSLAWHHLSLGEPEQARRSLGACATGPHPPRIEASRCCAEADYWLQAGDAQSARGWVTRAKAAQVGRPDAVVRQTMVEAKLAHAAGKWETARLLGIEARRLCARHKQDQLSGAVIALCRQLRGPAMARGRAPHTPVDVGAWPAAATSRLTPSS